jgi:hypothetical protein
MNISRKDAKTQRETNQDFLSLRLCGFARDRS